MKAVVEIAGQQFVVEKGSQIVTPKLDAENGAMLEFDKVLMTSDDDNVQIGEPTVAQAKVTATKMDDGREKKIIVFKKKRRKGYRKTMGHRQDYTRLMIEDIIVGVDEGESNGS